MEGEPYVKPDMICPLREIHCDDEVCTVGSICNLYDREMSEALGLKPNFPKEEQHGLDHPVIVPQVEVFTGKIIATPEEYSMTGVEIMVNILENPVYLEVRKFPDSAIYSTRKTGDFVEIVVENYREEYTSRTTTTIRKKDGDFQHLFDKENDFFDLGDLSFLNDDDDDH